MYIPGHRSVRLNSMFEAVELPTRIPDLNPCLSNVYANDFSHLSRIAGTELENGQAKGEREMIC
jgi:hypothetical protein